jgi:hypothetical protein
LFVFIQFDSEDRGFARSNAVRVRGGTEHEDFVAGNSDFARVHYCDLTRE